MKKYITLIVIVFCTASISLNAQYKKKVVSYVNKVLVPAGFQLTSRQTNFIASSVSKSIVMERFNYSSLPENVIVEFSNEASKMNSFSASTVRPLIEKNLAPKFLELLDFNKELLSKQNLTEAERNTFLATKAQSSGLSAAQLESILNSGFFYVPYVELYNRSTSRGERDIKNDEGKVVRKQKYTTYTHSIKVGLLWFKLNVDKSNNASVSFIGAANGWGDNEISRSGDQDDGAEGDVDWEAFESAVKVSSVNIANETKKLEEFKLTGGVTEVTTFGINLNLGTREGLGLDDSYWVEELMESESGEIKKERRGFVKVRKVGNNKKNESAFSYAQTITGSNYSPGLNVTEIPLIGINGLGGFGKIPIKISKFDDVFIFPDGKKFFLRIDEEYSGMFGPMASIQTSLANATNVSELWLHLGAALGFPNAQGKFFFYDYSKTLNPIDSSKNAGPGLGGYINLGLVKKYYFRRFGLVLQADGRFNATYLSDVGKDKNGDDLNYSLMHTAFGFDAKAGLEIYLTPAFSIGGGAEYSGAPVSNEWNVTVTDKDNNDTKLENAKGPEVRYSGLGWFVWFNYSLPSLN
ncbi:MAG: hypothetical protein Q8L88_15900 [Bacteroidota bacterium]|nr:hypothetical protein [Bacteroidota bacterium]